MTNSIDTHGVEVELKQAKDTLAEVKAEMMKYRDRTRRMTTEGRAEYIRLLDEHTSLTKAIWSMEDILHQIHGGRV